MRRYVFYIVIILIWAAIPLYFSHHLYAQSNTTVNLAIHYDITGAVLFSGTTIVTTWWQHYSSGTFLSPQIISSTWGTIYRTLVWSWSTLSWYMLITGNSIITFSWQNDGMYMLGWYLESTNHGWHPLDDITVTIDRTWPSLSMMQQSYTTTVGNTIILNRSTWSDSGIWWPIRYSYDIIGSSVWTVWTTLSIQTMSNTNRLNTTILPVGTYTIHIRSYDLLGNMSLLTGISLSLNPTTNTSGTSNNGQWLSDTTPVLMRDICLCGDQSNSYYDRRCSANWVSEAVYMATYCYVGSTGNSWLWWSWGLDRSVPWVDYIQTVLQTLGPDADRIQYTQYNKQEIVINQTVSWSVSKKNMTWKDTDVLGYSISRPDTWQLWKVTLFIDTLKSLLPSYYGGDDPEVSWYSATMCHANGINPWSWLFAIIWWRWLRIQYCTWWGYLMIGIIIAILLKRTKLYYYNDHGHTIISINGEPEQPTKRSYKKSR